MVVNLLHSSDILRRNNGGLPSTLLSDDPAQMNEPIPHDDTQPERAPVVLLEGIDDAVADVVIVGGGIGDLAGKACHSLEQVGT